jgi:hypothetical protein
VKRGEAQLLHPIRGIFMNRQDSFEIDEKENLIDNLSMTQYFLGSSIAFKWKWVAISMHQALYGSLILVLQGTDPRQTIIDRKVDSGKAIMFHVNRVPIDIIANSFGKDEATIREWITNPKLISFDEALHRVKQEDFLPPISNRKALITTPEEDDAIKKLSKGIRNEFEHFTPKGWIVFTSEFPRMARNVMRVIRFLILESNCPTLSTEQENRITESLNNIDKLLNP